MTLVRVGDVAEQLRGVTFAKADAVQRPHDGYLPVLTAGNIQGGRLALDALTYVPAAKVHKRQHVRRNDVVVCTSSGSLAVVGKAARSLGDFEGGFGAFLKVLRPGPQVDGGYFGHFFQTATYRRRVSSLAAGANINNLRSEHLDDLQLPLPPLDEQRRIAAILDHADALRAKRRQVLAHLDTLTQSIFHDMFGRQDWPQVALNGIAHVSSGITKGRRTTGSTVAVPYLAVANVQAGRLSLGQVKTIQATEDEIQRYALKRGDLVLTEGGDPDKLGRGTLWRGELPLCIHQNHIFRVRAGDDVLPDYLSAYVAGRSARSYFLRSAKQTTGIASMNMTQLKSLPVTIPPLEKQRSYLVRSEAVHAGRETLLQGLAAGDELFASLQSRAFRGEL